MSELTFLVELLLNHKLQKSTRDLVAERLKELELEMGSRPRASYASVSLPPNIANQPPSTIAAMLRHNTSGEIPVSNDGYQQAHFAESFQRGTGNMGEAQPVAVIAQTPAAMAALNSRQQAIADGAAGKTNASGGKRKF